MYWLSVVTAGSSAALACNVSSRANNALMLADRICGLLARARCMASSSVNNNCAFTGGAAGIWARAARQSSARLKLTSGVMYVIECNQYSVKEMNIGLTRIGRFVSAEAPASAGELRVF